MAVLMMQAVVKYFEVGEFLAAAGRYNERRSELGLPTYRFLGSAAGGTVNEVIAMAEFASIEAMDAADVALSDADDVRDILKEMYGHIVPGTVVERRFDDLG